MKSYIKHLVLISLIALSVPGYGEVFSLWPNAGKGNAGNAETALNPKNVWNEPVTINDVRLELNVGLIDMNAGDLCAHSVCLGNWQSYSDRSTSLGTSGAGSSSTSASSWGGSDCCNNCSLSVCTIVYGDGLTGDKAS